MSKYRILLCLTSIVVALFSPINFAQQFQISHFPHPAMPPFKTFIASVYDEMDIKYSIESMPATRGLIELNNARIDADVVRPISLLNKFPNIVVVEPVLYEAEMVLLCAKGKPCTKDVLHDPSKLVVTTKANQALLSGDFVQSQLITDETILRTLDLLRKGKVNYALYGTTLSYKRTLQQEFGVVKLKDVRLHHVISKQHIELLPMLEKTIRAKLHQFKPDDFTL